MRQITDAAAAATRKARRDRERAGRHRPGRAPVRRAGTAAAKPVGRRAGGAGRSR